jgi:hypothetical protein
MVLTGRVRIGEGSASRRVLLRAAAGGALLRAAAGGALAGAGLGLAGCDLVGRADTGPPAPDPLAGFYAATAGLVRRYEATVAAHATLAARLKPVLDNHRTHLAALAVDMALPSASAAPAPSAAASVPPQPPAALSALLAAEKAAVTAATDACLAAPGWRAPLLGSIAACRSSHLELLA